MNTHTHILWLCSCGGAYHLSMCVWCVYKCKLSSVCVCGKLSFSLSQGNVTGQNEFIIYSHYRAMPAYVIEYSVS